MGLFIKDLKLVVPEGQTEGNLRVKEGLIEAIGPKIQPEPGDRVFSGNGALCLPGFIDLHVHGSHGINLMDPDPEDVKRLANFFLTRGVTAFLATTAGPTIEKIIENCRAIRRAIESQDSGARIMGIHLEGPYFNKTTPARGANNPQWLREPDLMEVDQIMEVCGPHLKLFDIAPELKGAAQVIEQLVDHDITVAAAHTDADFETAQRAFDQGITHLIHTFNGMRRIHHRDPGITVAALLDERVWLEVIADGQHLHPAMVGLVYRLKGPYGMGAVTDATVLAGLEPGEYNFIGTRVIVDEGRAYLKEAGTLAGSIAGGIDMFNNLCSWGFSPADASTLCSHSPARHMGWDDFGSLEIGKRADLVIMKAGNIQWTFMDGDMVYGKDGMTL